MILQAPAQRRGHDPLRLRRTDGPPSGRQRRPSGLRRVSHRAVRGSPRSQGQVSHAAIPLGSCAFQARSMNPIRVRMNGFSQPRADSIGAAFGRIFNRALRVIPRFFSPLAPRNRNQLRSLKSHPDKCTFGSGRNNFHSAARGLIRNPLRVCKSQSGIVERDAKNRVWNGQFRADVEKMNRVTKNSLR